LPKPLWRELIGKRATGYINWRRGRSRAHDMDALTALVEDMRAHHPDHVAMTGDICNIGLPGSFPLLRNGLERSAALGRQPRSGQSRHLSALEPRHMTRELSPWMCGDDGVHAFPYLRRRDGVAIIGLCTGVPTLPFVAAGKLGLNQLARLEKILQETRDDMRVVLLHHPPVDGGGGIRISATTGLSSKSCTARARNWSCTATATRFQGRARPVQGTHSRARDLFGFVDRPQSAQARRLLPDRHRRQKPADRLHRAPAWSRRTVHTLLG